ncbi:hypothetical protein [Streptomyces sp. N35]|uniref:DUF6197 family protein n=1 Tax=Streptomyces sp. N35 TaxID=2795730 RepID=UPI0018F5F20A|nr:hypothetical protein [Streptomyces sp. N35]
MPRTALAPPPSTSARTLAAGLSLEARLALIDALMTERLELAALAYDINTAHLTSTRDLLDLADVITVPIDIDPSPATPYGTPVAALLQRAHRRMAVAGWCRGALRNAQGAICQLASIRAESGGRTALEHDATDVLLDAIRREFDGFDTVPSFNDAFTDGSMPLRMLGKAADLADARGL